MTASPSDEPRRAAEVAALAAGFGAYRGRIHDLVTRLAEGDWTFDQITQVTALSRRTVEQVLAALGEDAWQEPATATGPARFGVRQEQAHRYRQLFGDGRAREPGAELETRDDPSLATLAELIAGAPPPTSALDHVAATAETLSRRADWLADHFDLASSRLLFLGDHDLTSLATCLREPRTRAMVVDLDDRLLSYVDTEARRHGLRITCRHADLRFLMPAEARAWADVVVTDPPYTPRGIEVFAARAVTSLRDPRFGQIVIAYGFGEQHPGLGLQVQRTLHHLGLVFTAILPHFNVYSGAQAIGSRSDLYVCRATSGSVDAAARALRGDTAAIYTRGRQSLEAGTRSADLLTAACELAAADRALSVTAIVTDDPNADAGAAPEPARLSLGGLLREGLPTRVGAADGAVVVDLTREQDPALLRVLLACDTRRLVVLVRAGHPDVVSPGGLDSLRGLVAAKYRLETARMDRRGQQSPRHVVVVAERVTFERLDTAGQLARYVLDRAHGRLCAVLRDGVRRVSRTAPGGPISKDQARSLTEPLVTGVDPDTTSLLDLPRHQIDDLLGRLAAPALEVHPG